MIDAGTGRPPTRRVRKDLAVFFVVAFALPWSVWITRIGDDHGWWGWHVPTGVALWTMLPGTLLVAAATGGRRAVRDLLRRVARWRFGTGWYAVALGLPWALALTGTGVLLAIGGSSQFGTVMAGSAALSYFLIGVPLFTLTEELAWRGFALPRLQALLPALPAGLVLGVIWALWHIPTFLLPSEGDSALPYAGFALFVLAQSVLTTWLFNRSGGSVLIAGLFHAASDAVYAGSGAIGGDARLFWIVTLLGCAAAVAVAVIEGPATLAGRRAAAVTEPPTTTVAATPATR
jgi:membrane protease YdiL (CAAX protease family)